MDTSGMDTSDTGRAASKARELNAVDARVIRKVTAEETGGSYEVFEVYASRGPATPPHREPWPKTFYVLTGRLSVDVDSEAYDVGPGDCVSIPAGAANTFSVLTPTATFLTFSLSAGMGEFFADLDRSVPADQPLQVVVPALLDVTERHGVTFTGPALPGSSSYPGPLT